MTTYSDFAQKTRSQKITLCHVEPTQRVNQWTSHSGSIYKKTPSHFVIDVIEDGVSLTEAASSSVTTGEWFYDSESGILYVNSSDDLNPNTHTIYLKYRKFYSTIPVDLPYDLSTGAVVHYEGLLRSSSPVVQQLDDEQIGLAVESSTTLSFYNVSGHFDNIFDVLFWENKAVKIYSWSESILLSEKKKIFQGVIQNKSFSGQAVSFQCRDNLFQLRQPVSLATFSSSDGNIPDKFIGTPKRRLFGQFKQLECIPLSAILSGYTLTGTVSGTYGTTTITGIGTAFLDEVSPEDKVYVTINDLTYEFGVASVDSDTQLTLSDDIEASFIGQSLVNKPKRPWRKKNRTWHIAGHKLRAPSTTISAVIQDNRITLNDVSDFEVGDLIDVNGQSARIKRISGSTLILTQNLQTTPSVSDAVTREPVSKCYVNTGEAIIDRDFTITNTTKCEVVFDNLAEFNIAKQKSIQGTYTFTQNSRTVTVTGADLLNYFQPRDWIRNQSVNHTTWYEVLSVSETSLTLRTQYAGTTDNSASAYVKNPDLIDESSLITVNCVGLEYLSTWYKTAADAVKYLVEIDAGLTLDATSYATAKDKAPQKLSLAIPEKPAGSIPTIKDVITKINESVFGSLVNNINFDLVYNVLDTEKPTTIEAVKSDDIIGEFSVDTKSEIVEIVNVKYKPFVDIYTRENTFTDYSFTNDFVTKSVGTKRELNKTIYLYNDSEAQMIAQRYALYNSLSNSTLKFSAKLNMFTKSLNDIIYLQLERLYKRFGNQDKSKIGIISKIEKTGTNTSLEINDLGNVFNRVMSIAPNTASDFTSATDDEKIYNGYVLDDDLETPDTSNESFLGTNIIG